MDKQNLEYLLSVLLFRFWITQRINAKWNKSVIKEQTLYESNVWFKSYVLQVIKILGSQVVVCEA